MGVNESSEWTSTGVTNLVKRTASGNYYARYRVNGKLRLVSLRTKVFSVARQRLLTELADGRRHRHAQMAAMDGRPVMGDLITVYQDMIEQRADLAPSTIKARLCALKRIGRTWPGIEQMDPRQITPERVQEWATRLKRFGTGFAPPRSRGPSPKTVGNGASTVNQAVDTLRRLLDIAIARGALSSNPVRSGRSLSGDRLKLTPRQKRITLPARERFLELFEAMEHAGSGWSIEAANLARFLAFTGCRKGEANAMTWQQVDWKRNSMQVPGSKTESSDRVIPMTKPCRELLEKIRARRKEQMLEAKGAQPILLVRECQKSLDTACEKLGIERITHHDLRHLFATAAIESGVDIPTVARWLGHADGGALAMKVYGHLRDEHSQAQAARVTFGSTQMEITT